LCTQGRSILRLLFGPMLPGGQESRAILHMHSAYYRALSPKDKRVFEQHVGDLLEEKQWIGRGGPVTMEMRLRISAAIAQVTFGLGNLLLMHFSRIAVYPDAYRNPRTGRMHLGEVAPGAGLLVLSWKHFLEGFEEPNDGLNVALHEVAHALWFENTIPNGEDDFLDARELSRWRSLAAEEADRIRQGQGRLLRRYAATDQAEFFAVAVEYFFEQPEAFRDRMPDLYGSLSALLKQDPAKALAPDLQNI
ncbi:MAG TPA: zinc-dependent peptidase, partial [Flavobacteriales bacterium]|nr:zinc-dependent peptidase [Flavobacteriales bacterium]